MGRIHVGLGGIGWDLVDWVRLGGLGKIKDHFLGRTCMQKGETLWRTCMAHEGIPCMELEFNLS